MKNGFLAVLAIALAIAVTGQSASAGQTLLKVGGVPVEFVVWSPVPHHFSYRDLALSPERLRELRHEEVGMDELLYRSDIRLLSGGNVRETRTIARMFLSQEAIQEDGNLDFRVNAENETAIIETAVVLFEDGRIVPVMADAIQVVADNEEDIFSDRFRVLVPYPALKPGAIAVLKVRFEEDQGKYPLPWSRIFFPRVLHYREKFTVNIEGEPHSLVPEWHHDFDKMACEVRGETGFSCTAKQIEPYPVDPDISIYDVLPQLVIGEKLGWEEFRDTVDALVSPAMNGDGAVRREVDRLLRGIDTRDDTIERIHDFVTRKIRYVGFEYGEDGIRPRPSAVTLERRYGDCKDKTVLFIDMLQQAGIRAYPVLTSTERYDPDKVLMPASAYFDHMVSCIEPVAGEHERCVDLTDYHTASDVVSDYLQGAIRLNLGTGAARIDKMPEDPYLWSVEVKTRNRFTDKGDILEEQTRQFHGAYAALMRSKLAGLTREEKLEWALDDYQGNISESVEPEFQFGDLEEVNSAFRITSRARYEDSFRVQEMEIYKEYEPWLLYLVNNFTTANKTHDYHFSGLRYHSINEYVLPPDRVVDETGARITFDSPYGSYGREYSRHENTLTVVSDLEMPRRRVAPGELGKFNRFLADVRDNALIWFSTDGRIAEEGSGRD